MTTADPDESFEALHARGVESGNAGDHECALGFYRQAQTIRPDSHTLHVDMASSLAALRRHAEALRHSETAIGIDPKGVKAWTDAGLCLLEMRRLEPALQCYERALSLAPHDLAAWRGKAAVLAQAGRHGEALQALRHVAGLAADIDYLPGNILHLAMRLGDWSAWEAQVRSTLAAVDAGRRAAAPFSLMTVPASPAQLLASARIFAQHACPPAAGPLAPLPAGPRLRIGYFSADFGDHPTSQLIAGFFESHDRGRFETSAYSIGMRPAGALRSRIAGGVDHFIEVSGRADADIAAMARAAKLDIAVDLMGFTEGCRPMIFSHRAAPLQVSWLGFPGSTGTRFIDYIVADATVIGPPDRVYYDEKVVTLPGSYQVNDDRKIIAGPDSTRASVGLPPDGFVFACFNGQHKITPAMFDCWMRLLRQVPGSVLWLLLGGPQARAAMESEAEARGVERSRIVWAEPLALARHLARHAMADLFLDTAPYNAHTTCSDALWAGLPVLTVSGATFASRVAASLLNAVGLPELVTRTIVEYESRALALASTPGMCAALRQRLQSNRAVTPLFDTKIFTRRMEAAYEAMVHRQRQGLAPDHIDVPS